MIHSKLIMFDDKHVNITIMHPKLTRPVRVHGDTFYGVNQKVLAVRSASGQDSASMWSTRAPSSAN